LKHIRNRGPPPEILVQNIIEEKFREIAVLKCKNIEALQRALDRREDEES